MIAIIGCGSAGSRAARMLLQLGEPAESIVGFDPCVAAPESWPREVRYTPVSFQEGLVGAVPRDADTWVVCAPTHAHAGWLGAAAASRVRAVFVEKPVGDLCARGSLVGCQATLAARGAVVQVGYCWRWHPAVIAAKRWLDTQALNRVRLRATCAVDMRTWPGAAYAESLLEMSHELDSAYRLLGPGEVVSAHRGYEAWQITIRHLSGAFSAVTLLAQHGGYYRELSLVSDAGWWAWETVDFGDAGIVRSSDVMATGPVAKGWTPDGMYREELRDFLAAARAGAAVKCSLADGLTVLDWCAQASEKAKS